MLEGERGALSTFCGDMWRSRDLIRVLARKDFFVQYRRASFGVLWAVALPLVQAVVLAIVVPKLVRFDTEGSYVTFVFGGMVVWSMFSSAIASGSGSIVDGQDLSTRVYFPRLVLPVETVLARLYAFLPGAALLVIVTFVTGSGGPQILLLVPATLLATLLAVALSACLSALHVYFRDVRYLVQAAILAWFYLTPIIYPLSAIGSLRRWIEINPVTGVMELFRLATVGADPTWPTAVAWSLGWTLLFLVLGLAAHVRFDRIFVDRL